MANEQVKSAEDQKAALAKAKEEKVAADRKAAEALIPSETKPAGKMNPDELAAYGVNLPDGTDPQTRAIVENLVKQSLKAKAPEPQTEAEIQALSAEMAEKYGATPEPKGAIAQIIAAGQDEQRNAISSLQANLVERSGLAKMKPNRMSAVGREAFTDDLSKATPEQYRPNPFGAQAYLPVNAHDIRLAMQAEADMAARTINTDEAPGGGRYKVPVQTPITGEFIGYEWRDGNGQPVDPPEGED